MKLCRKYYLLLAGLKNEFLNDWIEKSASTDATTIPKVQNYPNHFNKTQHFWFFKGRKAKNVFALKIELLNSRELINFSQGAV